MEYEKPIVGSIKWSAAAFVIANPLKIRLASSFGCSQLWVNCRNFLSNFNVKHCPPRPNLSWERERERGMCVWPWRLWNLDRASWTRQSRRIYVKFYRFNRFTCRIQLHNLIVTSPEIQLLALDDQPPNVVARDFRTFETFANFICPSIHSYNFHEKNWRNALSSPRYLWDERFQNKFYSLKIVCDWNEARFYY